MVEPLDFDLGPELVRDVLCGGDVVYDELLGVPPGTPIRDNDAVVQPV